MTRLATVVLLALVGTASTTLLAWRGPSFTEEASDVKSFMDNVRYQTEGGSRPEAPPPSAGVQERPAAQQHDDDLYPGQQEFDDQLFHKANLIEEDLKHMPAFQGSARKPVIALQQQESEQDRARRYFATHGMAPIGDILGKYASKEELKKVLAEHDAALVGAVKAQLALATKRVDASEQDSSRQQLKEKMAAFEEAHKVYEQKVGFTQIVEKPPSAEMAKMDLPGDDDLDGYHKSWAAVDALKARGEEPANP